MSETLAGPVEFEQTIKHSRFLARAWPVESLTEIDALLARIHEFQASHHCWAWRIGEQYRFYDANEPAGTAGRPILAAIDGQAVDSVLAIVTRWYGGIKLGTGGLVRAYGGSAAECLRLAERCTIIELAQIKLSLAPGDQGAVRHLLQTAGAERLDEGFEGGSLWLLMQVPALALIELREQLVNATSGRLQWSRLDQPENADGSLE